MSGTCSKNGRNQKRITNLVRTPEVKQTGNPGRRTNNIIIGLKEIGWRDVAQGSIQGLVAGFGGHGNKTKSRKPG
jgi:hypothetical protein